MGHGRLRRLDARLGRRAKAFAAIVDAGFADVVRPHAPGPGTYTYWDYKQLSFPKKLGMRIDFVLGEPDAGGAG